ncbi:type I restriction-modification system specificity protein [Haemophilus influenzae]|uniref:restriction endonuclease subunit S n=1 Tax=Haemophilus influenzae TaxID=727 RepID=UPI000DA2B78E|nr:restriction endonuclease subunit S [Haemophilus influenzae]SQG36178.1 type I restriction-modification system specificity protein [Haemophilus influenzae]
MKNNRTFLEKLLDGAEVEWKPLKDILIRTKGTKITAAEMKVLHKDNAPLKIFAGGKTFALVNFEDIPEKDINKNPSIIVKSRGIIEFEYYDKPFSHKSEMWSYYSNDKNINIKYIYYVLKNQEPYFQNLGSKMQMPQIATPDTDKYLVPIPPLPVQTEIVKILDALTALTSELTRELILRQKQYEYYREKLLSEEELGKVGFEWKTLEELVEKTQNIKWKNNTKTYRYIDLTSVDRENNNITGTIEINALNAPSRAQKIVKENDVIFATTRPTQQRVALISKEFSDEIASTGYCVLRANTKIILPKWLFYFLSTINFKNYVEENQSGSAYPAISDSKVKEFKIPVPEITIQQRIIEKLDKFYSLTNSLLHGLPKEINNRKKQYSYYQKELLNFLGGNIYE